MLPDLRVWHESDPCSHALRNWIHIKVYSYWLWRLLPISRSDPRLIDNGQGHIINMAFVKKKSCWQLWFNLCSGLVQTSHVSTPVRNICTDRFKNIKSSSFILQSKTLNIIGRGVEGELFKQHKARIIHFSFIDNVNELVSVDEEGYIFIWKYTRWISVKSVDSIQSKSRFYFYSLQ